ncbi:MAG: CHAD domain-containing protein [Anaerolineaceae bacterium]|nr:CHAD domain-containing protein [Anaerolineaceae bacterium]
MTLITNPAICSYGIDVIQKNLIAFRKEIPGVIQSRDLEYVHRIRVASRRFARAIEIFETCYPSKRVKNWLKDILQTTRILGQARDLDIQAHCVKEYLQNRSEKDTRSGVKRLQLRIVQRRLHIQSILLEELDRLEKRKTLQKIDNHCCKLKRNNGEAVPIDSGSLYEFGHAAILTPMDEFLSYDEFVDQIEAVKELHAMRIAAKMLRYTMECFTSLYTDGLTGYLSIMHTIQDHLGLIHDCDVWQAMRFKFIEKERRRSEKYYGNDRVMERLLPGLQAFFEDRQKKTC